MVDKSRARRQGGSGLGLALCRRIAAAGSALQIETRAGQGHTGQRDAARLEGGAVMKLWEHPRLTGRSARRLCWPVPQCPPPFWQ